MFLNSVSLQKIFYSKKLNLILQPGPPCFQDDVIMASMPQVIIKEFHQSWYRQDCQAALRDDSDYDIEHIQTDAGLVQSGISFEPNRTASRSPRARTWCKIFQCIHILGFAVYVPKMEPITDRNRSGWLQAGRPTNIWGTPVPPRCPCRRRSHLH